MAIMPTTEMQSVDMGLSNRSPHPAAARAGAAKPVNAALAVRGSFAYIALTFSTLETLPGPGAKASGAKTLVLSGA